jgi:hypothetical protein
MERPVPVESASLFIDEKIKELGDWRGKTLAKVREIMREAEPEILEEWNERYFDRRLRGRFRQSVSGRYCGCVVFGAISRNPRICFTA